MTPILMRLGLPFAGAWALATVIEILAIALPVMLGVAMVIYVDRKIWASMALRRASPSPSPTHPSPWPRSSFTGCSPWPTG